MSAVNKNSFSFIKQLFVPLLCMLVLMNISTFLLHHIGDSILYSQHSIQAAMTLKRFSIFPYVFFIIGLTTLTMKFSIRSLLPKVLNFFILSLLTLTTIGIFVEIPPSNSLVIWWNHYFFHQKTPHIVEILEKWDLSLLFLITKMINPTILSVLLWGLINQATRFSEAVQYYIPLTIFSQLFSLPFTMNLFSIPEITENSIHHIPALTLFASIGILVILFIYYKMSQQLPLERWNLDSKDGLHLDRGSPMMSFGFLIAGFGVLGLFVDLYFKNQVHIFFPSPLNYTAYMANYNTVLGLGTGMIGGLSLLLGSWIIQKKGWGFTVLISPIIVGISLLLFLSATFFNLYPLKFGILFEILLKGLKTNLYIPLLQMAYLSIPSNYRFKTKGCAELLIAPLLGYLGGILLQAILKLFGTMTAVTPILASTSICLVALITLIASFLGNRKGLKLEDSKNSVKINP